MTIPFIKAQGAGNDFLFTFASELPEGFQEDSCPELARAICHRYRGIGADGWYLVEQPWAGVDARIRLWNSDGSYAELSGNGTRCAAAILAVDQPAGTEIKIATGSGVKVLELLDTAHATFRFEMEVGVPTLGDNSGAIELPLKDGPRDVTVVDVGNPQCAVPVESVDFDWKTLGAEIEGHQHFPKRTNVSFIAPVNQHTIDARFYERGAGPTLSSGTGSAGAAIAAILRGMAKSPVKVQTEDEPLEVRWDGMGHSARLTGPAQILGRGFFYFTLE
ncbi:MAG: diaminopimelate epimerase [Bryobacterales bacterium]|nr:diaminopimelate epimerase [Bryobacterales bacterium]